MSHCSKGEYAPEKKDVLDRAEGRWLNIYQQLAPELVAAQKAPGSAGPCPVHGGNDGFRIFKKTASTSNGGICQTCGIKPDGLSLLMWVRNWDFHTALQEVGSLLGVKDPYGRMGNGRHEPVTIAREAPVADKKASDEWLRESLRNLWKGTVALTDPSAEPARLYLRSRAILAWDRPELSRYVRFHPAMTYKDKTGKRTTHPGIVCTLIDPDGQAVTVNRLYLTVKGEKADVAEPKKMFPIPSDRALPGCAVPTSHAAVVLDVCEGLETALSIETATGLPVWPLVNSYLLEQFVPPACTKAVRIWADKDRKEGGQKAAQALKKRLWEMGIKAQILLPDMPIPDGSKGVDWNDVLRERGPLGFLGQEAYRAQR